MNASQKSEALRLADKYEAHGFLGDHSFAKDHWCTQAAAELRSQHARIAELEDVADMAIKRIAELAEETEAADNWRRLALQFDHHRMQAIGHLKAVTNPAACFDKYKAAKAFLSAPPLGGEEVLAQRIAKLSAAATQAQEDAPVGFAWSGWACMYPGKLPRLYGALEIASVNLDAANGDQLIHLSTSPGPQAQADALGALQSLTRYTVGSCGNGHMHTFAHPDGPFLRYAEVEATMNTQARNKKGIEQ